MSVRAQPDVELEISIISRSLLDRLGVTYRSCHEELIQDSKKRFHSPIGRLELRWHQRDKAKSFLETFFVVESVDSFVILGASAISKAKQCMACDIHTLGLKKQTAGMTSDSSMDDDDALNLETEYHRLIFMSEYRREDATRKKEARSRKAKGDREEGAGGT